MDHRRDDPNGRSLREGESFRFRKPKGLVPLGVPFGQSRRKGLALVGQENWSTFGDSCQEKRHRKGGQEKRLWGKLPFRVRFLLAG